MMDTIETKTLAVNNNSLRSRFEVALANRPDWAQSFTAVMVDDKARVTYSDSGRFGVGLQEAWNYIDRH